MDIPKDVKLYEHLIATLWFDEDSILHSVSKTSPRTMEVMADYADFLKKLTDNKKVLILTDITKASPLDKKTREFIEPHLKESFTAMAILSNAPMSDMIANVFIASNKPNFPTRMFLNEKDGKDWLMSFMG
ncbi:MAG: hypothetical protein ABIP51_13930 [Bacteroidia bacterium]